MTPTEKLAAVKAKLEEMEKRHHEGSYSGRFSGTTGECEGCEGNWPCDAARLLPSVKREVESLTGLAECYRTVPPSKEFLHRLDALYSDLCEDR